MPPPKPKPDADRFKRRLVPTDRMVKLGAESPPPVPAPKSEDAPSIRPPVRELVARWIKDADPRAIKGPKLPLLVIGLSQLLAGWDDSAASILFPEIRAEFGLSLTFLATLGSIFGFVALVSAVPMGWLADRIKRVYMVRFGAIVSNFSSILYATAQGIPQLVVSRAVGGLAGWVGGPAGYPLFTDYYPSSVRARVFAFIGVAGGIGGIVGPTIAGNLGEHFGWRSALLALSLLALVVSFSSFFLKEPKRGYVDRIEMGASEEVASREQKPVSLAEGWRAAMSIVTVRKLCYAAPFAHIGGTGVGLLMALYWAEVFQLGPQTRGYLATAGAVTGVVGLVIGAPIADRLLSHRPGAMMTVVGGMSLISAGVYVLLAFAPNIWIAIAIFLPLGMVGAMLGPTRAVILSLVVPARLRGLGIQTTSLWQIPGLIATPFIVGLVEAADLSLRRGILMFVPLLVVAAIIVMTAALGVDRDIRAARAASMAEEEIRRARASRRSKMLVCRDIDVEYDGVQVLFGVDFDVEEGQIVALLGTNGAGKSTLLRGIAGVQHVSNGAIFLDEQDITHVPPHENAANGIVLMPGGQAIFPTLSVEENLKTAAWMYWEDEEYVRQALDRAFELFPVLRERLHQPAGNLSGGEQQMVGLGQALLMRPRLLMIDELSLGLAPSLVDQLLDTIRRIHDQGTTIILVEQSLNVALRIAKRAVFMERGEIRFDGSTSELLTRSDLVRSVFIGGAVAGKGSSPSIGSRPTAQRETVLSVQEASVSFGGVQALSEVSIEVAAAEIVGVIGPNGAGKTTLFDVISGFVQQDGGSVLFAGSDISRMKADARARLGVGRSFQNAKLFPAMTVKEAVLLARERHISQTSLVLAAAWAPSLRKTERREARRVLDLISTLGLEAYADKFVSELSTGTRRTVDIACVMAAEPRLLLLDEPSSGLAQAESEELGAVLTRLVRETGCSLLVVEHDVGLIESVADRLIAMDLGQVLAAGPPEEVLQDPAVVRSYLAATDDLVPEQEDEDRGGKGQVPLDKVIQAMVSQSENETH